MKRKWKHIFYLMAAVIMLFFALPQIGEQAGTEANLFWMIWMMMAAVIMAANGNIILMSQEKEERLRQLKRMRALKLEQQILKRVQAKTSKPSKSKMRGIV